MDLFKLIEKLLSANSPVIVIFSLLLIYLFHKVLISPKIDAILQNTEKAKNIQDIDKLKEYISDKIEVANEKINMLIDESRNVNDKISQIKIDLMTTNKDTIKKLEASTEFFNDSLKQLLLSIEEVNSIIISIKEQNENDKVSNKEFKTVIKNLYKAVYSISNLINNVEEKISELKIIKSGDDEYFELMRKKEEIEQQLKKKKETLNVVNKKINGNLFAYIDQDNLLNDDEIEELLKRKE